MVDESILKLNCDEPDTIDLLSNTNIAKLRLLIADRKIVVIDEAQKVNNIGLTLKRIANKTKI